MRPIKLVMNAFGPFKEKVELDFTEFSQQNIFLVTGPTGAGKTTIFDAIAYALYGEASGDQRNVKEIKSQFSKDTDTCFVELTFEHQEKTYFIRREPVQMKPGKRAAVIESKGLVEFRHEDKLLSKVTEVNDKIFDLLGLNYKQFQQIVLLPQGQFRKLLNSSSGEKEIIFRDIFDTEGLLELQQAIKDQVKALKAASDTNRQMMEQALDKIVVVENEELEDAITRLDISHVLEKLSEANAQDEQQQIKNKETLNQLADQIDEVKKVINWLNDRRELKIKKAELDEADERIKKQDSQIKKHEEVQKLVRAEDRYLKKAQQVTDREKLLRDYQKNLEELADKVQKETEYFAPLKEAYGHIDTWRRDVQTLHQKEKAFEELSDLLENLEEVAKSGVKLDNILKDNASHQSEIERGRKRLLKELEKIEEAKTTLEVMEKEQRKLNEKQREFSLKHEKLEEFEKENKRHQELVQAYQEKEATYKKARKAYDHAVITYRQNLAGVLANGLEAETPCPVCGSTNHPQKAELAADAITDEALEAYEKAYKEANNESQIAAEKVRQCQKTVAFYVETNGISVDALPDTKAALRKDVIELTEKSEELSQQLTDLQAKVTKEKELREDLSENREAASEAVGVEKEMTAKLEENEKKQSEFNKQISFLKETLQGETVEEVIKIRTDLDGKIKEVDADYHNQQELLADLTNQTGQIEATISSDEKILKELEEECHALKENFENALEASGLDETFRTFLLESEVVETWRRESKQHTQQRHINTDRLDENNERLATLSDKDPQIATYEEKLEKLSAKKEVKEEEQQHLIQRFSLNTDAEEVLNKQVNEGGRIQEEYAIYSDLNDFASGSSATDNISFERYVLGIYLDDILEAANIRFTHMTNGRYTLERQENQTSLQGKRGLEINVMDEYTGRLRSVSTLSGGESFKASLSLAMGLSDVIQSQQGGISVDTLFIDEGFGTLDSDSLDIAIETLLELNTNGRMIGIISHVEELKTRIPSHITVTKTQAGSHVNMNRV